MEFWYSDYWDPNEHVCTLKPLPLCSSLTVARYDWTINRRGRFFNCYYTIVSEIADRLLLRKIVGYRCSTNRINQLLLVKTKKWNYSSLTNLNEMHDWGGQKAALALSHRGTPKVPHAPTKKKKRASGDKLGLYEGQGAKSGCVTYKAPG